MKKLLLCTLLISMGISNAGPIKNELFTPGSVIKGRIIRGDLSNQTITGITFKDVDFRADNLSNATFRNCNFTYSEGFCLSYPFDGANLNGAVFQDCKGIDIYKLLGAKKGDIGYIIGTGMFKRLSVAQNGMRSYTDTKPIWKGIGIGCAVLALAMALKNYKTIKAWVKKKIGFQEKAQAATAS